MLITEQRLIETEGGQGQPRKGHVVIRGAPDKLMDQLMVENSTTGLANNSIFVSFL